MNELVVIDTSVFVSSLLSEGSASRQVLRMCLSGELDPVIGNALFSEYESVLGREKIFAKTPLSIEDRQNFLDAFLSVCKWVDIHYLWRPNLKDEADNHLIELAVASGATFIITGNIKDFQAPELVFPDVTIITAHEFIEHKE